MNFIIFEKSINFLNYKMINRLSQLFLPQAYSYRPELIIKQNTFIFSPETDLIELAIKSDNFEMNKDALMEFIQQTKYPILVYVPNSDTFLIIYFNLEKNKINIDELPLFKEIPIDKYAGILMRILGYYRNFHLVFQALYSIGLQNLILENSPAILNDESR